MRKEERVITIGKWKHASINDRINMERRYSTIPMATKPFNPNNIFYQMGNRFTIYFDGDVVGDVEYADSILKQIDENINHYYGGKQ